MSHTDGGVRMKFRFSKACNFLTVGRISEKMLKREFHIMLKFQIDRTCLQRELVSTTFLLQTVYRLWV